MNGKKKGFTLIELLVVVLIIGILAAIALPQYQKAVLKSRYTTLMPIAKGIAEGNEAYFMEHGTYAEDPTELPIKGQESYPDGTTLDLQDTDEYTYVLASRADLPGLHHIIYQHHSKNFPSETHCEAAKDNKLANWVCKGAFKGTKLGGSLTTGYNSYLLDGAGHGITATAAAVLAGVACEEGLDEDHCKVTDNADGSKTKKECENPSDTTTCNWTTFNTDGTKTECEKKYSTYQDGGCVSTSEIAWVGHDGEMQQYAPYEITYDEDGNILSTKACSHRSYPPCSGMYLTTYNEDGTYQQKSFSCRSGSIGTDGECNGTVWEMWDHTYDANKKETSHRTCALNNPTSQCLSYTEGSDYSYDINGNRTTVRSCASNSIPLEGKCTNYSYGMDYSYDGNGNQVFDRICANGSIPADGNCTAYTSGIEYTNTYDEQNNLNYVKRNCSAYDTNNVCTQSVITGARKTIYEGDNFMGWTVVDEDLMGISGWREDANGKRDENSYFFCENGINWETLVCL